MDAPGDAEIAEGAVTTPYDPQRTALHRSLIEDAFEFVVTIRADLTIAFANGALERLLGYRIDDVIGQPITDYLHPDDAERALIAVSGWSTWGTPAGATSFRIRHTNGGWLTFDVTAAGVTDGDEEFFAVYGRPADYQHATEAVLARLLTDATRSRSLEPVLDVFEWRLNDTNVAIAWYEATIGHNVISTGLPTRFTGGADRPEAPWAAVRETGHPYFDLDLSTLDPELRKAASDVGLGGLWIEAVDDPATGVRALITVWTRPDGPSPYGHGFGMQLAKTYVELILRWRYQLAQLDVAAHTDPLTGLANRRSFFEVLESERRCGALLFCDLDGFKGVNDLLGHDAGDAVLRLVADRITECTRLGDVVARTGGDEFVVLASGVDDAQAAELAMRITAAVCKPIEIAGEVVRVGISIGVAQSDDGIDEGTLTEADHALLQLKSGRRPAAVGSNPLGR